MSKKSRQPTSDGIEEPRPGAPPSKRRLPECEWNFDKERLPVAELVACCLWEYARESATLRRARRQCMTGSADVTIRHPIEAVQMFIHESVFLSAQDVCLVHKLAADCHLPRTNSFPVPWQQLSKDERACRAQSVDLKLKPYVPFQRVQTARLQFPRQRSSDSAWRRGVAPLFPQWRGPYLERQLPHGFIAPNGTETCVVEIDWAHFTDKQITEAVAQSRPKKIPEPKNKGGHKREDWRAKLVRLGLLRLRGDRTAEAALQVLYKAFPPGKRPSKFAEPGELNREATKAVEDFQALFPFLLPAEMPRSWPLK